MVESDISKATKASDFTLLLEKETSKLTALCDEWQAILNKQPDESSNCTENGPESQPVLTEEDTGHIRSAIGKAHLLMNQRFKQFSGLIQDCESEKTPKVTPDDLRGFWEMVLIQVDDVYTKFAHLKSIELNQ